MKEEKILTVEDLKQNYEHVFDRNEGIVTARKVEIEKVPVNSKSQDGTDTQIIYERKEVSDYIFFKDKNGIVTPIPELSFMKEGEFNGRHYKSSESRQYGSTRIGCCAFDVEEWGFDVSDDEDLSQINRYSGPYRYDKHYRYVILGDIQKLVKVFESKESIKKPWTDLYHENKDENGKKCIRLVDLQGNVHSIKESGRVGEKGLKEKTFGPKGDYQLRVVYKDKEPVYAIFWDRPIVGEEVTDFCTLEELKEYYEKETIDFQKYGIPIEEVIENFNNTFMQGNFIPSLEKDNNIRKKEIENLVDEIAEVDEKDKNVSAQIETEKDKNKELKEEVREQEQSKEENGKSTNDNDSHDEV